MKNLKLFVAPLLGAALLTACGPKAIDVKDFKEKVRDNYNEDTLKGYFGKTLHLKDLNDGGKTYDYTVKSFYHYQGVISLPYKQFAYEGAGGDIPLPITMISMTDILSTDFVDFFENSMSGVRPKYYISGDTYTIEVNGNNEGIKISGKWIFDKNLVISHFEASGSSGAEQESYKYDFKYE